MLKRALFSLLMLAIPAAAALGLYQAYRVLYVSKEAGTAIPQPRPFLADSVALRKVINWLSNRNNRIAYDAGRKGLERGIADFTKIYGAEYRDNWAQVLAFVPIPGVSGSLFPNVRGKFVNTNDLGYRGTQNYLAQIAEAKQLKAKGTRIAVLTGGSVAYGLFSDDDQTDIVGYMNLLSREQHGMIRFYNFAMGSYTSAEELNALVTYAAALEPDLLVVMDGFNDALRLNEPGTYNVGIGVPYMYITARNAYPVAFQSEYLDRIYDVENVSTEQEAEFFEHYKRNLRLMARIMTGGGTIVLSTQPTSFFRNVCYQTGIKFLEKFARFYPKMVAAAREVAAEQKVAYVDLAGIFDGPPEKCRGTFADTVHMTSAGQKAVAQQLYGASIKALARTKPSR